MKSIIKLIVICFTLATVYSYSQEKIEEKAVKLVSEMKEKLIEAETDSLTVEQEKNLTTLYLDKLIEIKKIRKEETDDSVLKEKIKEVHKTYAKIINDTVLTKKQKQALKEFKNKK